MASYQLRSLVAHHSARQSRVSVQWDIQQEISVFRDVVEAKGLPTHQLSWNKVTNFFVWS